MTHDNPRVGNWMQTYTGRPFWPLDPRSNEVDIVDIAHALSMLCRYGGHVNHFYSVAEHCVLMCDYVIKMDYGHETAFEALLHDSAEAYLIDLPRPIKQAMPQYREIEDRVLNVILNKFHPWASSDLSLITKSLDNRILLTERATLLKPAPIPWNAEIEAATPLPVTINAWNPAWAEAEYLKRFNQLYQGGRR